MEDLWSLGAHDKEKEETYAKIYNKHVWKPMKISR